MQKNRPLGPNWQETTTINGYVTQYCLLPANTRTVTVTFPDDRVYKFQAAQQCTNFVPITAPTLGFTQVPTTGNTAGATLTPADGGATLIDSSIPGPQNLTDYNGNIYNPTVFKLTTAEGYVYVIDEKLGVISLTDPAGNSLTINASGIPNLSVQGSARAQQASHRRKEEPDEGQWNGTAYKPQPIRSMLSIRTRFLIGTRRVSTSPPVPKNTKPTSQIII